MARPGFNTDDLIFEAASTPQERARLDGVLWKLRLFLERVLDRFQLLRINRRLMMMRLRLRIILSRLLRQRMVQEGGPPGG